MDSQHDKDLSLNNELKPQSLFHQDSFNLEPERAGTSLFTHDEQLELEAAITERWSLNNVSTTIGLNPVSLLKEISPSSTPLIPTEALLKSLFSKPLAAFPISPILIVQPDIISQSKDLALAQIQTFLQQSDSFERLKLAFKIDSDRSTTEAILRDSWKSLPQIEIVPSQILGRADGAFDTTNNRIYLASNLVERGQVSEILPVLIEEIGHYLDVRLNGSRDSAGDEGAIFSDLVRGVDISPSEYIALINEDDHAIITVHNQQVLVEQSVNLPYTIKAEGTVSFNGSSDLDGNPLDLSDDALVYGGKGFSFNGNTILPVQYGSNGQPIYSNGKLVLVDKAVSVAAGYLQANVNGNARTQYANLTPPQIVATETVFVPTFAAIKQQELARKIPTGATLVTFNSSQNPMNSAADWGVKFPPGGTAALPKVVTVTGGGLNINGNVNLSNYVIVVNNGDINFNGAGTLNNVTLVTLTGNINLGSVQSSNVSVLAAGTINQNSGAKFSGNSLLANGAGDITFNGATTNTATTDNLRVISAGNLTFNGSAVARGSFLSQGNFNANGSTQIYGTIASKQNITFNGNSTITYTNIQASITTPSNLKLTIASDSGVSSSDNITKVSSPIITGSGDIGSVIKLVDGTVTIGTATVASDGTWSITTSALTNGSHSLVATATDVVGNISSASTALTVVIDTLAPQLTLTNSLTTAPLRNTAKLIGSIDGTGSNLASINYRWDNSTSTIQINPNSTGGFDQSLDFTGISNGVHTLTIAATDIAGNISTSSYNVNVALDKVAPVITAKLVTDTGSSNTDKITFDPTINGTIADASNVAGFKASFDGINYVSILPQKLADNSFTLTRTQLATVAGKPSLVDGNYTLHLIATDEFGNASQNYDLAFILDTTIATPTSLKLAVGSDTGASSSDNITKINTPTITGGGDAGATIKLIDGTLIIGQATVGANGIWSMTTSALINGSHSLIATATDVAGNISTNSTPLNLVIDALVPKLTLTTSIDQVPLNNTAKLIGTIDGTGSSLASMNYRWDNSTTSIQINPNSTGGFNQGLDFTGINNGAHTLTIIATDVAGNISTTSYNVNVAQDKTAPVITAKLTNDTGNNNDLITFDPTINGTVSDANTITIFKASFDGVNYVNILPQRQVNGSFSLNRTQLEIVAGKVLIDGNYTLRLIASDEFGNASASFNLAFALDTTITIPSNLKLASSSDTGVSNSDLITKINTPIITGNGNTGDTIQLKEGTTVLGTTTVASNGSWSITSSILTNGSHSLIATASDVAGNISAAATAVRITVDALTPQLTLAQALDTLPLKNNAKLVGNIDGTGSGISTINYRWDNGTSLIPITSSSTGGFNQGLDFTGINNGAHTLTIIATDVAGNISTNTYNVTVAQDKDAPVITAKLGNDTGNNSDLITFDPTIIGTVGDANTVTSFKASFDGVNYVNILPQRQVNGSFSLNRAQLETVAGKVLTDGSYTLRLIATDEFGNASPSTNLAFTLDTTISIPSNVKLATASDTGTSNSDNITKINTPTITGSGDVGSIVKIVEGTTVIGQATVGTNGTWQITTSALTNGNHSLIATATDVAGNISSAATPLNLVIDALLPQLTFTTLPDAAPLKNNAKLVGTIDGTGSSLSSISYQWDNSTTSISITPSSTGGFNQALDFTGIDNGAHTLTISATDIAGNISTTTYNVTVAQDKDAPVITAKLATDTGSSNSDNVTFEATVNGTVLDVSTLATFTASFDGINYVNILPQRLADGSFSLNRAQLETVAGRGLTDGNYTLRLIATDEFGNASPSTNLSFILDTKIATPSNLKLATASDTGTSNSDNITKINTPTITGSGDVGSIVKIVEGTTVIGQTTVGNDGTWAIVSTQLSDGVHNLTATATDLAGNISSNSSELTLKIDTALPQLLLERELAGVVLNNATRLAGQVTDTNPITLSYQFDGGTPISVSANTTGNFNTPFDFTGINDGGHNLSVTATDIAGNTLTRIYGVTIARGALLTLALLDDTGVSNTDGITSDTHVRGQVADRFQISRLEFSLDGNTNYADLTVALQLDGTFRLTPIQLDSLAGGRLSLGAHSLTARGILADGTLLSSATLNFTYQAANANVPTLTLATASDTNTIGDLVTSLGTVDLIAQAQPGSTVKLGTNTAVTDATGRATFSGVTLALGTNSLTLSTTDANGETASSSTIITRTNPDDVILTWNRIALNAIRRDNLTPPPVVAKVMAMVHTAMYDAANAIEQKYGVYRVDATPITGADAIAAAAEAAYRVLSTIYPNQQAYFNALLANSLNTGATAEAQAAGILLGDTVAANIIAWRKQDGAKNQVAFNPSTEIGKWQPELPNYDGALLPQWAGVTPFALTAGSQFRPPAPPSLGSVEYAQALNQTKALGARDNSTRTADQTQIALFWADGGGTYTPSGHWNEIAETAASIKGQSLIENARTFALLNIALADAGIGAWDAKYVYNTWRPITAIRNADKDGNSATTADPNWLPLINTPPFPEYVSGHSTFSAAAATVLTKAYGNNFSFNASSVGLPTVTRSYTSFAAAATEAGISRIYGGIHFDFANQAGSTLGQQIGDYVTGNFLQDNSQKLIQVGLTTDTAAFGVVNLDRITNNAGVTGKLTAAPVGAVLSAKIGNGSFVAIAVNSDGTFTVDSPKLALINGGNLPDQVYQLTFQLTDSTGSVLGTNNLNFTLDRSAPTIIINPLDGITPTGHITGTANDPSGATSGRFRVDGGAWVKFNSLADGSFDKVINPTGLSVGSHNIDLELADLAGNITGQSLSFNVGTGSNIYVSPATNPGWGRVFSNGFSLAEGNSLLVQNTVDVALGGTGKRSIDFDLVTNFDQSDTKGAIKDRVAVYLVDASGNPLALDSTHPGGVPLFSLSESGSEIIPGLVKFDGTHVSIDVSNVVGTNGKLVVQLLNQDGDAGTKLSLTNFTDILDPNGTAGTSVSPAVTPVAPGAATGLDSYMATTNAQLLLSNVSLDQATGKYTAELRVQNVGTTPLSQNLAVLLTGLPSGVTVANSSGNHPTGAPYLNFKTAISPNGLAGGAISNALRVEINDPSLVAFGFKPVILQGAAAPLPDLSSLRNLTVKVGDKIDIALTGELAIRTDVKLPTGQITGDSHLVFTPAPNQVGSYNFTLIDKLNGVEVTQNVTLNVVADPITTTRVTGIIADTSQAGLAGVLVELSGYQATTDANGKFVIVLPDGAPGDTLKVYGQRIQGGGITYPFIAEKMPLVLGHEIYRNVNNQIDRPIYLPTIDVTTGSTVNPGGVTVVSNPKLVGAQVTVAANSLFDKNGNAFAGVLSITEVPVSLTPAALPENLHPDMVVTIQPGDMVFNTPARLTLPNRAGYKAGLVMDLWSINPNTGLFDIVGKGKVSADGSVIETISGGVRNSSWHLFAPPEIVLNLDNNYEQQKVCKTCEDKQSFKSEVSTQTGIVSDDRDLVTYQSQGTTKGISLHYDSGRANPDKIFRINGEIISGTFAQDTVTAKVSIIANGIKQTLPGLNSGQAGGLNGGERIWTVNSPQLINTAIQGDLSNLQSGVYQTELEVGVRGIRPNQNTGQSVLIGTTNNQTDKVIVVNDSNSVFGGGWNVAGLQKLVINEDKSALLIDGDGSQWLFDPAIGNGFSSPAGDFSKLEKLVDGRFLRTTKDGTRYEFNTQGYMTKATDRLGNITQHIYNGSGQIQSIIDPVGLTTRFNYTGNRVTTIVDVNQRTTSLSYDGQGNLVSITDPGGITNTQYGYDSNHRVTSSIDKNGREKVGTYDEFGRAKTATREDGTSVQVNPIEVQGLLNQSQTTNLANPITPKALPTIPSSVYVDANGQVSRTTLDNRGEVVNRSDEIGLQTVNVRNNNYLITSQVDGNGHPITYQYDGQGNVIKIEDQIITDPITSLTGNLFSTNIRSISNLIIGNSNVVVTGDINNDGFTDIITTTPSNQFNVMLGDVQGNLARTYTVSSSTNYDSNNITQLELKDVNGDGYLDLIANLPADIYNSGGGGVGVARFAGVDPVLVFINQGNGQFADATILPFQATSDGFVTGDFNGDGKLDILARMDIPSSQDTNTYPVILYSGDGTGQFTEQPIYFPGIDTNSLFVGGGTNINAVDIDGDGRKEVIFNLYNSITTFKYNSISSAWVNTNNYLSDLYASHSKITTGDLNGDGFGDIVTVGSNQLNILLGRADGTFTTQVFNPFDSNLYYASDLFKIVDVNGDGKLDLVLGGKDNNFPGLTTKIYDLNSNGNLIQLGNTLKVEQASYQYQVADVADINGDGDLDLILKSSDGNSIGIIDNQSISAQATTLTKSYTYDPIFNQLTSVTDELGRRTLYNLDSTTGNVRSITKVVGALGGTDDVITNYTYTSKGQVDLITDALGYVTNYDYDVRGNLVKLTTAEGTTDQAVEQYEYDLAGNKIASIDALGRRTKYVYNSMNMLLQTTDALGGNTTYNYDKMGHQTRVTDVLGRVSQSTYDNRGRLSTTTDPNGGVTFDNYDNNGNLISSQDALGRTTSYQYDARNRLIKTIGVYGSITTTNYDLNDSISGTTDELGRKTQQFYDERNRLSREIDALGNQTKYTYDGANELIATTDAMGNKTQYQYDDLGRRIAVIDALNQTTRTEYDKLGNVTATVDARGNRTEYGYDALNRRVKIKDAIGSITQTVYDKVGNIISVTNPLNRTTSFNYDALDRRTSITDALNQTSIISYDAVGNILTTTDALNRTTSFAYDNLDRQISKTDALGHSATTSYDKVGNVLTTTDELGRTTSHVYDSRDREIKTIDALGYTTNLSYDTVGNVISVKDARGNTTSFAYDALDRQIKKTDALLHDATATYDAMGNVIAKTDELGRITSYGYDALDRQITRTNALNQTIRTGYDANDNVVSTTDELGRVTSYGYDVLDRQISSKDALNQTRSTVYDAMGNIVSKTDELGRTTTYAYDAIERQTAMTDALGHTTTTGYDAVGNVTQWLDGLNQTTKYTYDVLNRRVKVIDAKNQTTFTGYDFVGNVLAITDSVGNTTSYTYDALNRQITDTNSLSKTRSFGYDAVGSLVSSIDRNGRKRTYSYDVLNRQVAENWLDSSNAISRTFGYTYDAVGHLLTSTDPDSKYTYTYDLVDRVKSVDNTGTVGVPTVKLAYSYDAVGNLVSTTDTINGTQAGTNAYTYDVLNRATRITQSGAGVSSKRIDMSYDAASQMTGLSRYGNLAGTLAVANTSYNFDAVGRLTSLTHKKGATTIASYGLTYDAANRITQSSGTDGTQDYTYDATNQLTAVDHTTQVDEAYSYDANGNRTNTGYGTGANNRLLTDGVYNYSYDDEGNRTKRVEIATGKVTEYVWDYRNRLASVVFKDAGGAVTRTTEYAYDIDNRRIGKKVDGVTVERYVYDGSDIALVFDGAGVQTHRYLYGTGVDQILAQERGGSVVWALTDNLGTVRDVVDGGGGVVLNHFTYDSYGRVISQTNPAVDFRYGYTGREQDNETGLDYYRARYYDAGVGRFISEDPIGFSAGDNNLYRYVRNNPINFIDPSGNVGNNVNPLPGIDPNCLTQAPKPPLRKNPKCKKGSDFVPLTKERVEEIGIYAGVSQKARPKPGFTPEQERNRDEAAFRSNIGNAFEANILRSIQSASGNQYSKYRGGNYSSISRRIETNGKKEFVSPDLTGELSVRQVVVDRKTGAILRERVKLFEDSSIVEIKSTRQDITYKYDEYQTAGFLDFAENTKAYQAGQVPRLQYITVAGSRIDKDLIERATKRGVALYQGVAIEKCSSPGSIAVSKVILKNPAVYSKNQKSGRIILPDEIAPSTIRSNFVQFRP